MADESGLLRWENDILRATMDVRYAIEAFEKPKQKDLDIIRNAAEAFVRLAEQVHKQQVKEEQDYQRREYGNG